MNTRSSRTGSDNSTRPRSVYEQIVNAACGDELAQKARRAAQRGKRILSKKEQEEHKQKMREMRVRMAGELAKRIDEFVRAPVMDKPEYLPSFLAIRKILDKARASRREPGSQMKETIRDYNLWLDQCLAAEGRDIGTVTLLIDTIETLEDAQAGHPFARTIERHIKDTFGVELPDVTDWPSRAETVEREKWIRSIAHREDVIPLWLMDGLEIPPGLDDDEDDDEDEKDDDEDENGTLDFKD